MNDQCVMENLLLTTKGACDLYLHGTIESSTMNVHIASVAAPPRHSRPSSSIARRPR